MDFRDITVLITAAGNVFMPGTTQCLRNNNERKIKLVGVDMNDDPSMLEMVDVFYQVPRADDPTYVDVLLDICKKENVDIILPIMSAELNELAKNVDRFKAEGTIVSVSGYNSLQIANDKFLLLQFLKENGIQCADFYSVENTDELIDAVCSLGYPKNKVCVKATDASGSRGFRIIDANVTKFDSFFHDKPSSSIVTLDEFVSVLKERKSFPKLLVMEYLSGDEYTVDALADNGKVLECCVRKGLKMENSIMLDSVIVENRDIVEMCSKIIKMLNLDGNIGFDIREDDNGNPLIMECNPRITAGIPAFYHAGVNLPYLCVKKILGEDLGSNPIKYGTVVRRRWMEMSY